MASRGWADPLFGVVVQGVYRRDGRGELERLAGVIERAWTRRTVKTSTSVHEIKTVSHNHDFTSFSKVGLWKVCERSYGQRLSSRAWFLFLQRKRPTTPEIYYWRNSALIIVRSLIGCCPSLNFAPNKQPIRDTSRLTAELRHQKEIWDFSRAREVSSARKDVCLLRVL